MEPLLYVDVDNVGEEDEDTRETVPNKLLEWLWETFTELPLLLHCCCGWWCWMNGTTVPPLVQLFVLFRCSEDEGEHDEEEVEVAGGGGGDTDNGDVLDDEEDNEEEIEDTREKWAILFVSFSLLFTMPCTIVWLFPWIWRLFVLVLLVDDCWFDGEPGSELGGVGGIYRIFRCCDWLFGIENMETLLYVGPLEYVDEVADDDKPEEYGDDW